MALRNADQTLLAAVKITVAALEVPETDRALVRVAESIAETVDAMAPGMRMTLAPQHLGQLVKVLDVLEARAVKRRVPAEPEPAKAAPKNPIDDLRRAHAKRVARGGRTG